MFKSIDLRFYTISNCVIATGNTIADIVEITESQFLELVSAGGEIEYERFTMFANGSDHIALTVTLPDFPDAEYLELV